MAIKIKTDTAPDERKKSTAPLKEVGFDGGRHLMNGNREAGNVKASEGLKPNAPSENQASPVDTPSRTFRTRAPNNTFDRRAYMAEYQRMYRKKMKEAKKTV